LVRWKEFEMLKKVYVGNLPLNATEKQIRAMFERFGHVHSVSLITDRETGRPRGYGFVEMEGSGVKAATLALNGAAFGERHLFVRPARERLLATGHGQSKATW
jgi:RNA recognition motif-containing protein